MNLSKTIVVWLNPRKSGLMALIPPLALFVHKTHGNVSTYVFLCMSMYVYMFLYVSAHFYAFPYISIHFYTFLYICIHFYALPLGRFAGVILFARRTRGKRRAPRKLTGNPQETHRKLTGDSQETHLVLFVRRTRFV